MGQIRSADRARANRTALRSALGLPALAPGADLEHDHTEPHEAVDDVVATLALLDARVNEIAVAQETMLTVLKELLEVVEPAATTQRVEAVEVPRSPAELRTVTSVATATATQVRETVPATRLSDRLRRAMRELGTRPANAARA